MCLLKLISNEPDSSPHNEGEEGGEVNGFIGDKVSIITAAGGGGGGAVIASQEGIVNNTAAATSDYKGKDDDGHDGHSEEPTGWRARE